LDMGNETGIKAVVPSPIDDAIYDLEGHRMTTSYLKPGIYVKGGKKILIK